MQNKKLKLYSFIASAVICAGALFVLANPSVTNASNKSGKIFGDWKVVCEKPEKAKNEICFAQQVITAKQDDKTVPVASYQFSYDAKKNLRLAQVLPQGLLLQRGTSLIVGEKLIAPGKFTVCQNNTCIAISEISNSDLQAILAKESISVGMLNAEGKQLNLILSTKGLKEVLAEVK